VLALALDLVLADVAGAKLQLRQVGGLGATVLGRLLRRSFLGGPVGPFVRRFLALGLCRR
jgi:hypothetical protein